MGKRGHDGSMVVLGAVPLQLSPSVMLTTPPKLLRVFFGSFFLD